MGLDGQAGSRYTWDQGTIIMKQLLKSKAAIGIAVGLGLIGIVTAGYTLGKSPSIVGVYRCDGAPVTTLALNSDGTYTKSSRMIDSFDNIESVPSVVTSTGQYTLEGNRVYFKTKEGTPEAVFENRHDTLDFLISRTSDLSGRWTKD